VDAIVSLQTLAHLPDDRRAAALSEAARVLRPGGVLIFIERVAACDRAPASPLRGLITLGGSSASLQLSELDALRSSAPSSTVWEGVQYDLALEGQDPFALGVAKRGAGRAPAPGGGGGAKEERKRDRRKPSSAKGF
jgi:SAM-dependent methyltransferase